MGLSLSDDEAELVWLIASGGASDGKKGGGYWCYLCCISVVTTVC